MTQEDEPRPAGVEGLLLVDKPQGVTSHDVVDAVRRALGTRKVGHAGTLDPMATGLLLVGVGRATRLLRFLGDLPKTYEGTGVLGVQTTTLDADGKVTATSPVAVTREGLEAATAAFVGESLQRPPAFSAVKVGGRKLYEAARRGERLEAAPRPIRVDSFRIVDLERPSFRFVVTCSAGTYVRVLVADVGSALGCGAHLSRLRRTAIGPFDVARAAPPSDPGPPLPFERAVAHLPRVNLEELDEARAAANGSILAPAGIVGPYAVYSPDGRLIGIWRDTGAKAKPEMVLPPG
ncbi:MAG TPA: tRNA pseudouridine(55) synthase TruB [Actinomycetota bacterium]|nr:tRNA pseudouridine(55) synthase TruB [Actinomycetota bacterium]